MRKKFCPKCGRTTEKFYENLCRNCFLEKISVIEKLPDKMSVLICRGCGKFFAEKKEADSLHKILDIVLKNILKQPEVASASYRVSGDKLHVNIALKIQDVQKSEEKIIMLHTKKTICNLCSMKLGTYYNAIIQVRSFSKPIDKILKEIGSIISNLAKHDDFAFISKVEKTTNGYDLYVGSKNAANQIAKVMKSKYNAEIKISSKLSGVKKGKNVYKNTVFILIR
jgi:nonsense-mediated mRNA decay protein 3